MKLEDYNTYKEDGTKASESLLKELINTYIEFYNKYKSESAIELKTIKDKIKELYQEEIYFGLIDEAQKLVKFNVTEKSKNYFIPIFTDITEYNNGKDKISKLFLDKLDLKVLTTEDIRNISIEDKNFKGVILNPHSQNFSIDLENL